MSILTDALIDAKADLCWNHQQQQLKKEVKVDCICAQLADMIYLTRQEVAKEIEALANGIKPKNKFIAKYAPVDAKEIVWRAARIARGNRD